MVLIQPSDVEQCEASGNVAVSGARPGELFCIRP
jgi:hypothetical protein